MEAKLKRSKSDAGVALVDIENCHNGHRFAAEETARVAERLVSWYEKNKRTMPWRAREVETAPAQHKAYCVWVSEVMLQQTQVSVVSAFFERFLQRWPTLSALASASLDQILEVWSGLGFYRRARMLHAAAVQVEKELGGVIPSTAEELQKLPGIGRYTAGAIASIAFGEKAPIVDGNVVRVISRLRAIGGNPKASQHVAAVWKLSSELVRTVADAGTFNQSLMELGATVCTPLAPKCDVCPVREDCLAIRPDPLHWRTESQEPCSLCQDWVPSAPQGDPTRYPGKKPKISKSPLFSLMIILRVDGTHFVLVKRDEQGLLGGLKEFPTFDWKDRSSLPGKSEQVAGRAQLFSRCFVDPVNCGAPTKLGTFEHTFSHIDQTVHVEMVDVVGPVNLKPGVVMVPHDTVKDSGVAKSTNKALKLVAKKTK